MPGSGTSRRRTGPERAPAGPGTARQRRGLSMNWGSFDSLKVSTWCGLRLKARQTRPTVDFDSPVSAAIDARDRWVASLGVRSRVATASSSILSSLIFLGAPGRCSSWSPSSRRSRKRRRHLPTVCGQMPSSAATSWFVFPSARSSTIRHRWASACDDFARLDQRTSVSRSSPVKVNSAIGRPVRAMESGCRYEADFQAQDTRARIWL